MKLKSACFIAVRELQIWLARDKSYDPHSRKNTRKAISVLKKLGKIA
jgi:hypothetical protein